MTTWKEKMAQDTARVEGLPNYIGNMPPDPSPREALEIDERKTHNVRCIGCGKFLGKTPKWNQCANCDTRDYDY